MKTLIIGIRSLGLVALAASLSTLTARADILCVSYPNTNTIEKFDLATGHDLGVFANTGLNEPYGLAFDRAGNLYVANVAGNTIEKFSQTGNDLGVFANTGLDLPVGLAFDNSGNLYVSNPHGGNLQFTPGYIEKFTPTGVGSRFATVGKDPQAVAFDSVGNLYVANGNDNTISKITPGGVTSIFARTSSVGGVAVDRADNVYVSIYFSNAIEEFSPAGTDLGVFANTGLSHPQGLTFDRAGNLYITNDNNSISLIDPHGVVSLFARTNSFPQFIAIQGPPIITSPTTATATVGQLFVYQVIATGTPNSYTATPLPPGMNFDTVSGILGGVPTTPGTTQIQLTASNSVGTDMKTLTLTVQPAPVSGPITASGTSITARTGVPFRFEVFTTGGNETARLTATGLPQGLSADSATGVISGTPTTDGSFGVILTVTQGAVTFTSTLQLTFTSDPAIPVITSAREASLTVGQPFRYTITTDSLNHSGTNFSVSGNLPLGLGLDPATGIISGTYNPSDQNGGALLGNVQTNTNNSSGSGTNPLSFFQSVSATAKNISTRLAVGTGDNVLIGGFIVTGNAPKKVIVRAIGPELTGRGVPGAMQDPTLELHNGTGALIARNDDWHSTQIGGLITSNQVAAIQASTLAPTDPRESAMIVTLAQNNGDPNSTTGHYTAIVKGKNGTTGVALVEAYDVGTASLDVSANAKLANISTRGMVQTGDNVMIGGFIIRGDMSPTVVVRAIGPSLAQHGISNPLGDPTLELHDHNGTLIAFNDNWMSASNRQAIINSGLAPSNNLESAILMSLTPGNYTAIVRGAGGTTGVALVETYVIP